MPSEDSLKRYARAYNTHLTATLTENADGTTTQRQTMRTKPADPLIGQFVVFCAGTSASNSDAAKWASMGLGEVKQEVGGYYLVRFIFGNAGPQYNPKWLPSHLSWQRH
jgi:hypothetical protein